MNTRSLYNRRTFTAALALALATGAVHVDAAEPAHERLQALMARHHDRLAYIEREQTALNESVDAVKRLYPRGTPSADVLDGMLREVTNRIAALQAQQPQPAGLVALDERRAQLLGTIKQAQTDSVAQFNEAQRSADPTKARKDLQDKLQTHFKAQSDELRELNRQRDALLASVTPSAELVAAITRRNDLLLVVQIDERRKLIAAAKARLPVDERDIAQLRAALAEQMR